jgi:hypothetical protein
MRITIFGIGFVLLLTILQVQSSPGHNVHDYYKCNSDYARRNYRHCEEVDQESRNSGRVGRGLEQHYNQATTSNIHIITVLASVLLGLNQYLRV